MKQCRFCDNELPFYGSDTCSTCLEVQYLEGIINDSIVKDEFKEKEKRNG